jgi:transposase
MTSIHPQIEIEAVYAADYLHLVNHVMLDLKIPQQINEQVPCDMPCKVMPGEMVQAIVLDILTGRRALVHLEEWASRVDIQKLISPDVEASYFNDDAIGRMLDRIHEANPHQLFSDIMLQTWKKEGDSSLFFHSDTTSQSVYGAYLLPENSSIPYSNNAAEESSENDSLLITKGYSRDRPGANQFQYGVIVDKNGISIHTDVHDGNTSDKTWNANVISKLDKQLKRLNLSEFVYVADAAAMTQETLNQVKEAGGYLITRGTRNLKMVKEALDQVDRQEDQWSEPWTVEKTKRDTVYRVQEVASVYANQPVRLIVVESSSLAKTKRNALEKQRKEEFKKLQTIQKEWAQQTFHCLEDAEKAITRWLKKNPIRFYQMESRIVSIPPKKRLAPSHSEKIEPSAESYRIEIHSLVQDDLRFEQLVRQGSRFVLVSTVPPVYKEMEMDAIQILRAYKGQINVEMSFSYLKDPFFVDEVYLKKPHRVQVFAYILLLSLLVYKVFQQRIREQMKGQEPLRGVGKRKLHQPTAQAVFHIFKGIQVIIFRLPTGERIRQLVSPLTVDQKRVLHFLGLDDSVYT